jgi:hypothetical protein
MRAKTGSARGQLLFGKLVLIYQMPKVGSQTIEATLRHYPLGYRIYRFHFLSGAFAKTLRRGLTADQPDPAWKQDAQKQLDSMRTISRALRIRRFLSFCGVNIPKLHVITGVREVISLALASIFENDLCFAPEPESMTPEKCREALLHPKTFKTLKNWFDLELRPFIGVDVYGAGFPHEEGYAVYENHFARVLVYRFEAFERLRTLLAKFLHRNIPRLVNFDLGEAKEYGVQYHSVRKALKLPPEFVASLYDCRMMRHFYSENERDRWHARWTGLDLEQSLGEPKSPVKARAGSETKNCHFLADASTSAKGLHRDISSTHERQPPSGG